MSREAFLASLKKGGKQTSAVALKEEPAPVPVAEPPIPKPAGTVVQDVRIAIDDVRSLEASSVTAVMNQALNNPSLSPMQVVAIMTKAVKNIEEVIEKFNDDASKEFEMRMAADPTAKKIIVGGAEWTRNQDRETWTYSPAIKALQEEEKANGKATMKVVTAKKSFKVSVLKDA